MPLFFFPGSEHCQYYVFPFASYCTAAFPSNLARKEEKKHKLFDLKAWHALLKMDDLEMNQRNWGTRHAVNNKERTFLSAFITRGDTTAGSQRAVRHRVFPLSPEDELIGRLTAVVNIWYCHFTPIIPASFWLSFPTPLLTATQAHVDAILLFWVKIAA